MRNLPGSGFGNWVWGISDNCGLDNCGSDVLVRHIAVWLSFIGLVLLSGCDETPKVMPSTIPSSHFSADNPSQTSYNTTMNFSSSGMLRAILHAGRVQTYDQKRYTWLDSGVKVDFYDRKGLHSSILTSASAKVNTVNNNMTAYGHVHIVSDSGTKVDTDSLEWDNQKQTLRSDAAVHIVEKNGRITDGIGFESDQNLEHYHILRPTIVQPGDAFGSRRPSSPSENPLKPAVPTLPGEAATKGGPGFGLGLSKDTGAVK